MGEKNGDDVQRQVSYVQRSCIGYIGFAFFLFACPSVDWLIGFERGIAIHDRFRHDVCACRAHDTRGETVTRKLKRERVTSKGKLFGSVGESTKTTRHCTRYILIVR